MTLGVTCPPGLGKMELSVLLVFSMTVKKPAWGGSFDSIIVSQEGFSDWHTGVC